MSRIAVIGEAMLELSQLSAEDTRLAFGGDTLNTAVYLARLGHAPHYMTALGRDPYSDTMLAQWAQEGVQTAHVLRHPTRLPGLYAVKTDAAGERSFYYWRDTSAARAFFDTPGASDALEVAAAADWLYLSGITLSILPPAERAMLIQTAQRVRARGGAVVFDPNYRPRGWASREEAHRAMAAIAPHVSIALPTFEDEHALHGAAGADVHAARWSASTLVVMKCGADGAVIYARDRPPERVLVPQTLKPMDTTGAGDSFNAALLDGLLRGLSPTQATRNGHVLAGAVIQHPGAIIPQAAMPALL